MHKEQGAPIYNRQFVKFSLIWLVLKKVFLAIRSIWLYISLQICYPGKINIYIVNSVRNKFQVILKNSAKLKIGRFLMVDGPLYIKGEQQGIISIGDNVFFYHNCSITSIERVSIGNNCAILQTMLLL